MTPPKTLYSKLKMLRMLRNIFFSTFFVVSKVFLNFATNHWQYGFSESRWCDILVNLITTLAVIWKI